MGTYLTDEQIARCRTELSLVFSLPYSGDLIGTAWEQILAEVKGGVWIAIRDNRPRPDLYVQFPNGTRLNYSVKTEGLRVSAERRTAEDFLGFQEDFIVARPKVDDLLSPGEAIGTLSADQLGAKVLQYYNDQIVRRYKWDVISFLLRVENREFIYWEEKPPVLYNPTEYWWRDSERATGGNRNINGYPRSVSPDQHPLPRATFKWTSGGKQFYVLYTIPQDSDTWTVAPRELTLEEIREALREKLRAKKAILDEPSSS